LVPARTVVFLFPVPLRYHQWINIYSIQYVTIIAGLFASLFGRVLGRWRGALAALIALVDPYVLWDVGFQLSFAATLPVIVYHFQRLSLTSLIANPIILPAQPAVMILAVLLGMVYNPLG
jgi:predicted membrane metal-binding protein